MGAILFKQDNKEGEYIKLLEDALKFEDHPAIVERILGNIYEQIKTPQFTAEYWAEIYTKTKDKKTKVSIKAKPIKVVLKIFSDSSGFLATAIL